MAMESGFLGRGVQNCPHWHATFEAAVILSNPNVLSRSSIPEKFNSQLRVVLWRLYLVNGVMLRNEEIECKGPGSPPRSTTSTATRGGSILSFVWGSEIYEWFTTCRIHRDFPNDSHGVCCSRCWSLVDGWWRNKHPPCMLNSFKNYLSYFYIPWNFEKKQPESNNQLTDWLIWLWSLFGIFVQVDFNVYVNGIMGASQARIIIIAWLAQNVVAYLSVFRAWTGTNMKRSRNMWRVRSHSTDFWWCLVNVNPKKGCEWGETSLRWSFKLMNHHVQWFTANSPI